MPTIPKPSSGVTLMAVVAVDQLRGFRPSDRSQRGLLLSLGNYPGNVLLLQAAPSPAVHRSFSTPCISASFRVSDDTDSSRTRVEILAGRRAPGVRALAVEMTIALTSGNQMVQTAGGLGGAYHLRNSRGSELAIVKPIDEPQRLAGLFAHQPSLNRLVQAGETGVREVAAYLLDHHGFAGVPPTGLVMLPHHVPPVTASIQRFVPHDFDAGDLGPSRFSVSAVRRIGILDVRVFNIDRHAGNILVKKSYVQEQGNGCATEGPLELVPIDHGLCLPESLEDPYFEWLHWPQATTPFSDEELNYIRQLDPLQDAQLLRTELPMLRESSIRILILCTIFLKRAADAGLCLTDIGGMMTREFSCTGEREQKRSVLEILCHEAMAISEAVLDEVILNDKNGECNVTNPFPYLTSRTPSGKPPIVPLKLASSLSASQFGSAHVLKHLNGDIDDDGNGDKIEIFDSYEKGEGGSAEMVNDDGFGNELKPLRLTKSFSIPAIVENNEFSGLSFINMSDNQWNMFLLKFEELLPQAFRSRKKDQLKPRFGASCIF